MKKKRKVTDLEEFALYHIYKPYQSMVSKRVTLSNAVGMLILDPVWAKCVMDRINEIGFYFPQYIIHSLVDFIQEYQEEAKNETN